MQDETPESTNCEICTANYFKYKCPRCEIRTCSLSCCKKHKEDHSCSGIREKTVFSRKDSYNYVHFLSDYRLLDGIDQRNETRELLLMKTDRLVKRKPDKSALKRHAEELGMNLKCSNSLLLERVRRNRTRFSKPDECWLWTLEFVFFPFVKFADELVNESSNWFHKLEKPIKVLLHDVKESSNLETLWEERVIKRERVSIVNESENNSFAIWLNGSLESEKEPNFHFYIQVENYELSNSSTSSFSRSFSRRQIDVDTTLKRILTAQSNVIYEYPTIFVSRVMI
ncbi:Box C/D snoRNA protein 1 [Cichlidogyrus casuarinus]|uniref:Box C/D snoRNA protein 1 n=1 Tax=Cichlidogyrus casuarinus TaxID=1844966 RepID=A0ABD2QIE2_9PLAT